MEQIRLVFDRPLLTYRVLVPLLVIFWFVSSVGQSEDHSAPADERWDWIGTTGWVLFGVVFLATVLFTIVLLARRILRRGATD